MNREEEERICTLVVESLRKRFPTLPDDAIVRTVASIAMTFRDARIHDYIPLLIEREARDALSQGVAARRQLDSTTLQTSTGLHRHLARSA